MVRAWGASCGHSPPLSGATHVWDDLVPPQRSWAGEYPGPRMIFPVVSAEPPAGVRIQPRDPEVVFQPSGGGP